MVCPSMDIKMTAVGVRLVGVTVLIVGCVSNVVNSTSKTRPMDSKLIGPALLAERAQTERSAGKLGLALRDYELAARMAAGSSEGHEKAMSTVFALDAARAAEELERYEVSERWYERSLAWWWAFRPEWLSTGMDKGDNTGRFGDWVLKTAQEGLKRIQERVEGQRPGLVEIKRQLPFLSLPPATKLDNKQEATKRALQDQLRKGASGAGLLLELGALYLEEGRVNDAIVLAIPLCIRS